MRIIALVHKDNGVSYHRLIVPLMMMQDVDIYLTNNLLENLEEQFEKGCDILMYNRTLPEKHWPKLKELKEKYGFKICVDLDDYWHLDKHHILYDVYQEMDYAVHQINHIKFADVVICTHARLAFETGLINPNVHVCPNAIPKSGQFDIKREFSPFIRLFWQGSDTHEADIDILEYPISQLMPIATKIKMIFGGMIEAGMTIKGQEITEDTLSLHVLRKMAWVYTNGFSLQYKLLKVEPVTNYYSMYAHADICLIPLVRSRFNGFKSNLKVLEAANLGLPVIASAVDPYLDLPINYCKSSKDWVGHIKRLVQFPQRQKDEGQKLKEYCDEHFNFEKINQHRKEILEHECSRQRVS